MPILKEPSSEAAHPDRVCRPATEASGGPSVAVVGSSFLDYVRPATPDGAPSAPSVPCHGGVGRNVAENLGWLGVGVELFTLLSPDEAGRQVEEHLRGAGVRVFAIQVPGGLGRFIGFATKDGDVRRHEVVQPPLDRLVWPFVKKRLSSTVRYLVMETGLDYATVEQALDHADQHEMVSIGLPTRLGEVGPRWEILRRFHCLVLNQTEGSHILGLALEEADAAVAGVRRLNDAGVAWAIITLGERGVVVGMKEGMLKSFTAPLAGVVSTLGAGDAFAAGFVAGLAVLDAIEDAVSVGLEMASRTVQSAEVVRRQPCADVLWAQLHKRRPCEEPIGT